MPRFRLTLAYDGTEFHGWQRQEPPGLPPLRTVQGVLEAAVRDVVRAPVLVVGASRTDAGVHALGQVAAFSAETSVPVERMPLAITSRLPEDVQVREAAIVADDFDPIGDCRSKGYRYRVLHTGPPAHWPDLFQRRTTYFSYHALDPDRMDEAARLLEGEHDFASFAQASHGRETTVRTIHSCRVRATGPYALELDVSGSGFLYNMVRIVAGTLVEVGRGRLVPEDMTRIIAAQDRRAAGPTLPPEGLCLMWVRYGEGPSACAPTSGAPPGTPAEE
ncbi:MAG: tRNA pseudouridine(38-40) synthase TruA [Phycisphaerales bacterium]|nr:tRNA pseudouridine(38-40) synthase TruA [Phycisphaerales bacterium]